MQPSIWQGRRDGEGALHRRWHQVVTRLPAAGSLEGADVVLGFACDEGVGRNQGRPGAAEGPDAIRRALANLPRPQDRLLFDAGNLRCVDGELETAQQRLGARIAEILERGGRPLVLGGGHEMAWGSFLGIQAFLQDTAEPLGVVNFDAHFDLRDPADGANSGTPFRQMAEWCETNARPFDYLVLGINPAANTPALFDYAGEHGVVWFEDRDCVAAELPRITQALDRFVAAHRYLYLTICLDAFPAAVAPGVSAPGVPGMCPHTGLALLRAAVRACHQHGVRLMVLDIAEMNPAYDRDGITARWAARLIQEVLS
jgi:formiminoglutamase